LWTVNPLPILKGFAAIKVGTKWGFMNRKGEYPIQPQFDEVGFFSEGLAAVKVGAKWGFVDGKGKWVIPASYDGAGYFSEGLAAAKIGKPWGFINKSVGIVGIANLGAIRETVRGRVDHFIHDYFAANSK
jgi:hypothetical protein